MYTSGVILAILVSCVMLGNVALAKKKASPPKWKTSSMPFQKKSIESHLEGSTVKLDCKSLGYPKPTIKWMKYGQPIRKDTARMSTRKYGLTLENVTADMSGNYTCLVENKHGALEWTFILDVQANVWPLVVEGPQNVTQMVGSDAIFTCRILNDPKASILWQKVNKRKGTKRPKTEFLPSGDDKHVLVIENIKKESEGEYRCMAGNIMGLKYSSAWLHVVEPVTSFVAPRPDDMNNVDKNNKVDIFGQPYDPDDGGVFGYDGTYYTTTRRPRIKNKGRGKTGRKKNKKNKNRLPKTQPTIPTTTSTPSTPSSPVWIWSEDSTSQTPSTFRFNDWQDSTVSNKVWTFDDVNTVPAGNGDGRYNRKPGPTQNGNIGSSTGDKKQKKDISEWKIYTIVGAVGGVVLLIGLVAITIAVCCPKQEGAVYKSTPV